MTTQTLDKIIESNGCNGYDVNAAMVEAVATEYADSPEVKRRHWNELLNAMQEKASWILLTKTYWETTEFAEDKDSYDIKGVLTAKDFACETEGDWTALFRLCGLADESNSVHWSDK